MPDATPFIDPDATADELSAQVAALPDDPALLKHLLDARLAEIEHLKLLVAKLRRAQFGRRSGAARSAWSRWRTNFLIWR